MPLFTHASIQPQLNKKKLKSFVNNNCIKYTPSVHSIWCCTFSFWSKLSGVLHNQEDINCLFSNLHIQRSLFLITIFCKVLKEVLLFLQKHLICKYYYEILFSLRNMHIISCHTPQIPMLSILINLERCTFS